jgi:hypothetical protein
MRVQATNSDSYIADTYCHLVIYCSLGERAINLIIIAEGIPQPFCVSASFEKAVFKHAKCFEEIFRAPWSMETPLR